MPKLAREQRGSRAPTWNDLQARGTPDPDRAIIRSRRTRTGRRSNAPASPREVAQTPRAHARNVERVYQAMLEAQLVVKQARESGDHEWRQQCAITARERRAAWLAISGHIDERRNIEVDQGSETNPVRAV